MSTERELQPTNNANNRYGLVHKVAKKAKLIMEGHAQTATELSTSRAIKTALKDFTDSSSAI